MSCPLLLVKSLFSRRFTVCLSPLRFRLSVEICINVTSWSPSIVLKFALIISPEFLNLRLGSFGIWVFENFSFTWILTLVWKCEAESCDASNLVATSLCKLIKCLSATVFWRFIQNDANFSDDLSASTYGPEYKIMGACLAMRGAYLKACSFPEHTKPSIRLCLKDCLCFSFSSFAPSRHMWRWCGCQGQAFGWCFQSDCCDR